MSERTLVFGRILPADQARHLPVWRPAPLTGEAAQAGARRRPQTTQERHAIQAALARGQSGRQDAAAEPGAAAPAGEAAPAGDPAEIERIKTAAFDEGYAAGYDHGSAAARDEAERLQAAALAASGIFERFETELAPRLLDLALEIARQVVRRELAVEGNVILPVVRDAFGQLTGGETGRQLLLHPADVQLVRAHLGEELELGQWKIVEDASLSPGGCRIRTQQSDIDATLETRWQRTLAVLGRDAAWSGPHA